MSKKFVALVDNIIFKGKRYDKGSSVLIDDKEQMHNGRWMEMSEYLKNKKLLLRKHLI